MRMMSSTRLVSELHFRLQTLGFFTKSLLQVLWYYTKSLQTVVEKGASHHSSPLSLRGLKYEAIRSAAMMRE